MPQRSSGWCSLFIAGSIAAGACSTPAVRSQPAPTPLAVLPASSATGAPAGSTVPLAQPGTPPKLAVRSYEPRDPAVVRACTAFARTYCGRTEECAKVDLELRFGSLSRCIEQNAAWCARESEARDSGFTPETVNACRQALGARACRRWRRLEDLPIDACQPKGSRRFEEPCFTGAQCVSGFCAKKRILEGPGEGLVIPCGTCAPVAALDDRCAGPDLPFFGCPAGAMCSRGLCIGPFADEGDACAAGAWYHTCYGSFPQDATPTNLECDLQTRPYPVCRRPPEPEHCTSSAECREGRFCDSHRKVCTRKRLAQAGEPCPDESVACVAGATCRDTCLAPGAAGAACDLDHPCAWPTSCVNEACRLLDPAVCDDEGTTNPLAPTPT